MNQPPAEFESYVRAIVEQLGETDHGPVRQVQMIVQHAGVELAQQILKETLDIEAGGGLFTADGARRRTPGGVYFYVAKGKLNANLRQIIFPGYGQSVKGVTIEWEDRHPLVAPLLKERTFGDLTMAPRITLHGHARSIASNDNSYVMVLEHALQPVAYGRGIPTPPSDPTLYTVYMGKGQYERVEKALKKNPRDNLIVEGACMLDTQTMTIAVFALIVSTRATEKKLRQEMQQPALTGSDSDTTAILPARPHVLENSRKARQNKTAKSAQTDPVKPIAVEEPAPAPVVSAPVDSAPARPASVHNELTTLPVSNASPVPESETNSAAQQLRELELAAVTLRERISLMQTRNQPGIAMTRKLLENTERQIEVLRREA